MSDLNESQNGPPVIDCAYIQAGRRRVEEMRTSNSHFLQPPTVLELEEALGDRVNKCELLAKNWRNRIYRLELGSGGIAIAKQIVMGTDASVLYQHDQLQALAKLQIPRLRIPKPIALLHAKRILVMDFARGNTITTLVSSDTNGNNLLSACELAGNILARIHTAWTKEIAPMPIELLARDLAAAPWHLSSSEQKILQSSLALLSKAEVAIGQIYYDYKPANLLFENNELSLIDPPEMLWLGVHLWDFARFRGDMRRALWRLSLRRPLHRRRAIVREAVAKFEAEYIENFTRRYPDAGLFPAVTRFFELQHTALSMTIHKGKAKPSLITLPLLELEKRWLFRRLARELP